MKGSLEPSESEIDDAIHALEDAGFTYGNLLRMAARDWVFNRHLKDLLEEIRDSAARVNAAQGSAQRLAAGAKAVELLEKIEEVVHVVVDARISEIEHRARHDAAATAGAASNRKKREEMVAIRKEYDAWQDNPDGYTYRSVAHFAKIMIGRSSYLTSTKNLQRRCTEWKAERKKNIVS